MELDRTHVSLQVGVTHKLNATPNASEVAADNPRVVARADGRVRANHDALRPLGEGTLTATDGVGTAECDFTIVTWPTNRLTLEVVEEQTAWRISRDLDGSLLVASGTSLFRSTDGNATRTSVGTLPAVPDTPPILATPFGYFFTNQGRVWRSADLATWTLSFDSGTLIWCLYHGWTWQQIDGVGYVYFTEYSSGTPSNRHKLYRGVFDGETVTWTTLLDFFSIDEYNADPVNNVPSVKHIHSIFVDPYTDHLWLGTGDSDHECRLMHSSDLGATWTTVGQGSQKWRLLSMWFTERYVYWNMDTHEPQSIHRLPRTSFSGGWPVITGPGDDYSENVADLFNGSLWYHLWTVDDEGDPIVIMTATAEGQIRDWRARVFGIKELADGSVEVDELLSIESSDPSVYNPFTQLVPQAVDSAGFIYFRGRQATHDGIWKTRLVRLAPTARVPVTDYAFVSPTFPA